MQIDVRPDHLEIIKNALKLHVPDRKVVAFGSRVKWTARDTSDLDLCVMGDDKISFETLAALRNELSDSNLPYKVDVIDWASIAPDFRQIIDQRNEEIQKPIKELKFISVGQFSPFIYGKSLPETTRNTQGSVPVYGSSGFVGRHDKALTNGPTVIIGRKGTIGKVTYSTSPCWPIDTTFFVEGSADRNIRYTYYALKSLGLEQMNSDSAVPGLNRDNAHARVLPKRSVQEQTKIADILSALDDKIELNNKMNETLEATAQALFKSWFVDFEPVKAKMEGSKPEGLTAELAALFPDKLIDSPLGQIPQGWKVKSISELAKVVKGRSYKSSELQESDTALVTLKSFLRGGRYRKDGLKSFSGTYKPEQLVVSGDLIVAYTDVTQQAEVIGKPAIVAFTKEFAKLVASLDVGIIRPLNDSHKLFYYFLFLTERFQSHIYGHTSGTTVLHLSKEGVPSYKLAYPPSEKLIDIFSDIARDIYGRIAANDAQVTELSELRDTLLPKLISGELRVGDAASRIKEAV